MAAQRLVVDLSDGPSSTNRHRVPASRRAFKADKKSVTFEVIPGRAVERFVEVCGLSAYLAVT
jgi:hypothetical protein